MGYVYLTDIVQQLPAEFRRKAARLVSAKAVLAARIDAFHEFTEAEALPLDNAYWHMATEEWAEGAYARLYSVLMVLAPLAWIAWATWRPRALTNET